MHSYNTSSSRTYADFVIDFLISMGIDTIFGVPGGAIEPLMNSVAVASRQGRIRFIVARHESGAAFMADGYFRETGKIAVVCSTTGPGATNLVTGVASATAEVIPMLVITAQTPLPKFGKRALQESSCTSIDTLSIFKAITKYNTLVSHGEQIETKLRTALLTAMQVPYGPVHISFPSDVLREPTERLLSYVPPPMNFAAVDPESLRKLEQKILDSSCFAVYVGEGVGAASVEIQRFIEQTRALFVASPMGKAWVNERHPQYRGVYGFAGHASAKALINDSGVDTLLVVGASLDELSTGAWNSAFMNEKMVHIDANFEHFTRSPGAALHVLGDINAIFKLLNEVLISRYLDIIMFNHEIPDYTKNPMGGPATIENIEACKTAPGAIKPQQLMAYLSNNLPDDTRIFVDAGNSWSWATHYLMRPDILGYYRIAMGFGSMAWSVGASVGSCVANKTPTVCIVGDGSYLMSSHEITVAIQHELPVVFVVLNDSVMGMVMHGQRMGGQESIGWELPIIDFAAMASACGANSIIINTVAELNLLNIGSLFKRNGPTLIDVRIDREEIPPMGDRIKNLSSKESATPGG
jgi:acetolactate synthase-1/2/3 large subunit